MTWYGRAPIDRTACSRGLYNLPSHSQHPMHAQGLHSSPRSTQLRACCSNIQPRLIYTPSYLLLVTRALYSSALESQQREAPPRLHFEQADNTRPVHQVAARMGWPLRRLRGGCITAAGAGCTAAASRLTPATLGRDTCSGSGVAGRALPPLRAACLRLARCIAEESEVCFNCDTGTVLALRSLAHISADAAVSTAARVLSTAARVPTLRAVQ